MLNNKPLLSSRCDTTNYWFGVLIDTINDFSVQICMQCDIWPYRTLNPFDNWNLNYVDIFLTPLSHPQPYAILRLPCIYGCSIELHSREFTEPATFVYFRESGSNRRIQTSIFKCFDNSLHHRQSQCMYLWRLVPCAYLPIYLFT